MGAPTGNGRASSLLPTQLPMNGASRLNVIRAATAAGDLSMHTQKYTRQLRMATTARPLLSRPVLAWHWSYNLPAPFGPPFPELRSPALQPEPTPPVFTGILARSQHVERIIRSHSVPENNGMRATAISLLVAAPALVSAATAPLRKRIGGYATFYYTQTGNAYVIAMVFHCATR
jgi:hypothetical protein